ncbi:MAG: phage holin family protein [Candidatus Gracilibacteria bacterium]|jgi:putative membrane protein
MGLIFSPLISIALNGVTLYVITKFVDGVTYTGGIKFFILGGAVIGVLNFILKPLLKLAVFPILIISGGLFFMVVNGVLLWSLTYILNYLHLSGVSITFPNLGSYVIGAIVFGIVNWLVNLIK